MLFLRPALPVVVAEDTLAALETLVAASPKRGAVPEEAQPEAPQ